MHCGIAYHLILGDRYPESADHQIRKFTRTGIEKEDKMYKTPVLFSPSASNVFKFVLLQRYQGQEATFETNQLQKPPIESDFSSYFSSAA